MYCLRITYINFRNTNSSCIAGYKLIQDDIVGTDLENIDLDFRYECNPDIRETTLFYHVPFPFLMKEGWAPGSVNLFETFELTIGQSPSAREYMQSSRQQRDQMYDELFEAIRQNEFVEDETPDAALVQAAIMRNR